jgi:hypothetical protein
MIDKEYLESIHAIAVANMASSQACLKAIEMLQSQAEDDKYLKPEAAAAAIGDISPAILVERCRDGRFKRGQEFISTSDGKRSTYFLKPSAVRKFFETDPAKRPPLRRVV